MRTTQFKDVRQTIVIMATIGGVAAVAGCFVSLPAALIALLLTSALICVFLAYTRRRQQQIGSLCDLIEITLQTSKTISNVFHIAYEKDELSTLFLSIQNMSDTLHQHSLHRHQDKKYIKDFITNTSRQLRIPLTSINIVASFLASGNLSPDRQNELIQELNFLLDATNQLITTQLKTVRIDAGTTKLKQEPLDVHAVIDKIIKHMADLLGTKRITLKIDPKEPTTIQGDEPWLTVALSNIIRNSLDSPGTSQIEIEVVHSHAVTEIHVKNDGKCLDHQSLPQLFDNSYRSKTIQELNLNADLTLSRMIISHHNGIVTLENLQRGGYCFIIKFYHPVR
ncbi:MAG: HAMP domain-containing histidine kinase [Peptococcaceae bacterium]|nr:HAMP domain-containing histidine kinase [Peptococcaceae bacterium]